MTKDARLFQWQTFIGHAKKMRSNQGGIRGLGKSLRFVEKIFTN